MGIGNENSPTSHFNVGININPTSSAFFGKEYVHYVGTIRYSLILHTVSKSTVFETLSVFFLTLACDFLHFGYFIFDFLRRIHAGTHTKFFFAAIDGTDRAIAWRYSSICES